MTALHRNFIGGQSLRVKRGERIQVYNPARDTALAEIPGTSADMVIAPYRRRRRRREAGPSYRRSSVPTPLRRISAKIRDNVDNIVTACPR